MSPTACRECGAALPDGSHACAACGAGMPPVPVAPHRPLPPRPPPEKERPWWRTAIDWLILAFVCAIVGGLAYALSADADARATEKKEVAREADHLLKVGVWAQDTTSSAPAPKSGPVPTSARAKRIWVVSRMIVDGSLWRMEIMKRHGLSSQYIPATWGTPRYWANASAYPEVGRFVEGRVAAVAEIEKNAAAWTEGRTVALARESGLPAAEIRKIFPSDYVREASGEAYLADALLKLHRHLVRIDPRVRLEGSELFFEREEDLRRLEELQAAVRKAAAEAERARQSKLAAEQAALTRVLR